MEQFIKKLEHLYNGMTGSQKKVAQYVITHYDEVAFLTLEEIADKIGVSTTTVIRFARNLGYSGYSDFISNMQNIMKARVSLPERLNVSVENLKHEDDLLIKSFLRDVDNLNATLNMLRTEELNSVIDLMMSKKTIYVIGLRSSFSLAHYFATSLGQIRDNVRLIEAVGFIYPEEIGSATKDDLCIAFTFSRYAKVTMEVMRWMKKEGVKVITVTDSIISPVSEFSDITLACEVKGVTFKRSMVAPLSLINYLVGAIAVRDKDKAMKVLSKTENLLKHGHYFATSMF